MKPLAAVIVLAIVVAIGIELVLSRTKEPPPSNVVPRFHEAWQPAVGAPRSQPIFDRFAKCMGDATDLDRSAECACEGDLARSKLPPAPHACADYLAKRHTVAALPVDQQLRELDAPAATDVVIPTMSVITFMRSCERAGDPSTKRTVRCACRVDYVLEHADQRTYSSNGQLLAAIDSQVAASERYCQ
ncbi:MAG: hypothetical protein ABI591_22310 [Kofleriaceae bacterium]